MARLAGEQHHRDVVADALRERRSDFEAFVRARARPEDADDIVQLAALRAVERADSLDDPDRVVAWLYRIHRNLIIDVSRKRASERKYVDAMAEIPEQPELPVADPCECSVSQARRLRPAYASILSLVDSDGLQLTEAARRLDVSANNAAVRLHRARRALKQAMLEHCGVTDARECAACRCVEDACCAA
ncbi:MAG: sigma-70 family RNA polymerase sigma factor [Actinomycetota bacterium]